MRTKNLCHRNEKKRNKTFVWLKVATVNISRNTVPDWVTFQIDEAIFICYWPKF